MKPSQFVALTTFVVTALCLIPPAAAHIQLVEPAQRESAQKDGPCGSVGSTRGPAQTFRPGETITVRWTETIDHPSHYRISFDDDGTDDFADPPTMMDFYSNDTVLLDNITDEDAADQEAEITFPNITCDNCTLQVVQVMYDKPPYTVGGNDLYYQCADIILSGDPAEMGTNNSMPDMGGDLVDMGSTEGDMGTNRPNCGRDEFYNAVSGECEADDDPNEGETGDMGAMQPDDMMADSDDSACSTIGAAASWPVLLVLALFWRRR